MSAPVQNTVSEELGSMNMQKHPVDEDWKEADEDELDTFITGEKQIIPAIVSGIHSDDRHTRLIATIKIRRLLQNRPGHVGIQSIINSGLVSTVVEMLSSEDSKFRAEAVWIVSNIASGTTGQKATVADAGAIPKLVAMSLTDAGDAQEQALRALGYIGWDSARCRDLVVKAGGVKLALDVLDGPENYTEKVQVAASWVLTPYLTARPGAQFALQVTGQMIPILTKFICEPSVISWDTPGYAVKALAQICTNEEAAELTIKTGILPRLVELCTKGDNDLRCDAVRCIGQFTAGTEASTDAAVAAGLLDALKACIGHHSVMIRENACWAASNVAAGSLSQVNALLNDGLLLILVAIVKDKDEVEKPRNEATRALANLVDKALVHPELVEPLIEGGCIEAFSDAIVAEYFYTQRLAVQSLQKLLGIVSAFQNRALELFKVADGIPRLRAVRYEHSGDPEIMRTAHEILKDHYPDFVKRARVREGVKPPFNTPKDYEKKLRNTASWVLSYYLTPRPGDELEPEETSQVIPVLAKFLRGTEEIGWATIKYVVKALDQICATEAAAELAIKTGVLPRRLIKWKIGLLATFVMNQSSFEGITAVK
ncbi:Importin alpha subunit (Karyopherin alpha subunit) (Serine-rich RNA polymerase I suppressor protein) [Tulasnella sp. 424]|nr:Importin alpha subunit (Karyopherin alpha subunit) (Serine-rich RNA polymerase I suppressor protein) [Tulasnella sp. 424]KAG8971044.1 Importin alpha subunit (Karyopherin alpha subunit) (Serine-rich RNA polymerase I suppressor protein) [Tulasnella sp. 425]